MPIRIRSTIGCSAPRTGIRRSIPEPDRLDITRANIRPLSFGGSIHFCLGAQLARIEAEIVIATLLRRLPNLALDDPEHPDWRQTFVLRGLMELPASW